MTSPRRFGRHAAPAAHPFRAGHGEEDVSHDEAPYCIVVGASGGEGLKQLIALVAALPDDLRAAVMIVLHRPMDRPSYLETILSGAAHLPVVTPKDGDRLAAGVCYLGTPDLHLSIGSGPRICLQPDRVYRNRTIDLLFASAAKHLQARVIGVVLTGALSDGAAGLKAIRHAGGLAMVLDAQWSAIPGMPRAALAAVRDAETYATVEAIAAALVNHVQDRGNAGG